MAVVTDYNNSRDGLIIIFATAYNGSYDELWWQSRRTMAAVATDYSNSRDQLALYR